MNRRQALRLLGLGAVTATAAGCGLFSATRQPRLLVSKAPLPAPFRVPLPVPAVAKPVRSTPSTDYYELAQRAADVPIMPGRTTRVWGYDGQFPGPTIEARSGRRTVVRVRNGLAEPTVTHLHGGRTPPSSDGYPTDLVAPGTFREYEFPLDQRAATLWYHDHRMDRTGPQVWQGLAGMFVVRDDEEAALPLPSGDRDVPLMICDRSFEADGSMPYPAAPDGHGASLEFMGGVLGDVILVNGTPWPRLSVDRARYRFRIVNASNARVYELALSAGDLVRVGTDGGLLTVPVRASSVRLSPGERADVVVDFGRYGVGSHVELRNLAASGRQGQVMRFEVARSVRDDSAVPDRLSRVEVLDPARAKATREFSFTSGDMAHGTGWLINDRPFDPHRVDARPRLGDVEIWQLTSDVAHPVHLHLAHFQVLSVNGERRSGPPEWKDTVELRDSEVVEIITRFTGYRGRYVLHCHNLEHEDMAMMTNFEVV
jgi:FtsP/CotA-like multicopper oxidase with cupredoxin domain